MKEKRRHRRSQLRLEVELIYPGGGTRRAVTRDLSIGGIYVESPGESPALGTTLTLTFLPSAHHPDPYFMRVRVQRQASGGFAMMFVDFGLDDLNFIEKLLPPDQPAGENRS